ncbi:hypothetical protein Tco_1120654 [Tanacetum coccineum]
MSKRARSTRGQSSISQEVSLEEKIRRFRVFENGMHQMRHDALARRPIHSGDIIDWEFLASQGLDQDFFESINNDPFSGPQWVNLFRINEPVYQELVRKFFASFEFDASPCRYDPENLGVRFRLGGDQWEISLLEMGWRADLYTERKSRENVTLSGLRKAKTLATREVEEKDEPDEAAEREAANEWAEGQQEERANWMYDHTVRQFQHLSTRDNLDLHLQIDQFLRRETDYPPYGYHRFMPLGYEYHPGPSYDGSS